VLCVRILRIDSEGARTYEAKAWVDEEEFYSTTLANMFWTKPLGDLARDGWELVGVTHESALMGSWIEGWETSTSRPVQTNFFLKRPVRPPAFGRD